MKKCVTKHHAHWACNGGHSVIFSPSPSSSVNFVKIVVIKRGIYVVPHMCSVFSCCWLWLWCYSPSQTCIRFLLSFGGILFVQYMCCTWRSLMKFLVMAGPLSRPFPHCYFYKQKRLSLYCGKLYSPSRPIICWPLGVDFHVWKKRHAIQNVSHMSDPNSALH